MSVVTSKSTSGVDQSGEPKNECLSAKTKKILCALVVIAALGCMAAGIIGVCGHCQIGSLSTLTQVQAIALMATGLVGIILLFIGAKGLCCGKKNTRVNDPNTALNRHDKAVDALKKKRQEREVEEARERAEKGAAQKSAREEREAKEAQEKKDKKSAKKRDREEREVKEAQERAAAEAEEIRKQKEVQEAQEKADKAATEKKEREAKERANQEAKKLAALPLLTELKINAPSPLLETIDFPKLPGGEVNLEILQIPLQFWVKYGMGVRDSMGDLKMISEPGMGFGMDYLRQMSQPHCKDFVAAVHARIEALDQAVQLKARLQRIPFPKFLEVKVGHILAPWPRGNLRFLLMTEEELSRVKVSDITPSGNVQKLSEIICDPLHKLIANKKIFNPIELTKDKIDNLLLTDLAKVKAEQFNAAPQLFPLITLMLMDLKEFKNLDFVKVSAKAGDEDRMLQLTAALFADNEGGQNSVAAKRLLSCSPEAIYELVLFLPYHMWEHLGLPLIAEIDFSKIFAKTTQKNRHNLVTLIFLDNTGDENSPAAKRLRGMQKSQIAIIKPYLPPHLHKFIS